MLNRIKILKDHQSQQNLLSSADLKVQVQTARISKMQIKSVNTLKKKKLLV